MVSVGWMEMTRRVVVFIGVGVLVSFAAAIYHRGALDTHEADYEVAESAARIAADEVLEKRGAKMEAALELQAEAVASLAGSLERYLGKLAVTDARAESRWLQDREERTSLGNAIDQERREIRELAREMHERR